MKRGSDWSNDITFKIILTVSYNIFKLAVCKQNPISACFNFMPFILEVNVCYYTFQVQYSRTHTVRKTSEIQGNIFYLK